MRVDAKIFANEVTGTAYTGLFDTTREKRNARKTGPAGDGAHRSGNQSRFQTRMNAPVLLVVELHSPHCASWKISVFDRLDSCGGTSTVPNTPPKLRATLSKKPDSNTIASTGSVQCFIIGVEVAMRRI